MESIAFEIYESSIGFYAIDSNKNVGFGSTGEEAIADLLLSYDDVDIDVEGFEFHAAS